MTPKQFRHAINRLDLSQVKAAKFLGVDPRTVRKWVAGDSRIPHSVELLLTLLPKVDTNTPAECPHEPSNTHQDQ
jgi:DNA-binding transcriptional regulator YiaG